MREQIKNEAIILKARARRYAMQAIYQYLLTGDDLAKIKIQFEQSDDNAEFDTFFFNDIIENINKNQFEYEAIISLYSDREIKLISYVEHAILLVATFELDSGITPPLVVLNQAVLLARKFAGPDSYKYINGVLDKFYKNPKK